MDVIRLVGIAMAALVAASVPGLSQEAGTSGMCGQPSVLTQKLEGQVAPGFADFSMVLRPVRSEPSYVEFEVTEPTEVTFETLARENDAVLTVFGTDGQVVAWDDDGAGNLDARVAATLQTGSYCAQLRLISAAPIADPLTVLIGYEGLPPDPMAVASEAVASICADPARSPVLAEGLRAGEAPSVNGTIDPASSLRSYRLSLTDPLTLQIDAMSQTFDTMLAVHDMTGATLWENDDHADTQGSDSRILEAFEPGDYCVVVKPFSGSEGSFALTVAVQGGDGMDTGNVETVQ